MSDTGWIETGCYATVESTALLLVSTRSLPNPPLFKFALFSLKNIICRNQNFGKFYLSAKGEKQPKECCRPLPPHHLLFSNLASDSRAETCFLCQIALIENCVKGVSLAMAFRQHYPFLIQYHPDHPHRELLGPPQHQHDILHLHLFENHHFSGSQAEQ